METLSGNIVLNRRPTLIHTTSSPRMASTDSLIAENKLKEKVLTVKDLKQAQAIYGCNAVRGLYELEVEK